MTVNNPSDRCLSPAAIERFAAGAASDAESASVRRHLVTCAACRMQVELQAKDSNILFEKIRGAFTGPRAAGDDPDATLEDRGRLAVGRGDTELDAGSVSERLRRGGTAEQSASPSSPILSIEGYEILRELHRGGQGVVYQAVQQSTKRKVAIKILLDGAYASRSARKRFDREIELVANLKHPNIISIFHSGQTKDGHQYCVMDYIRGLPLDQHVREKKLTLEETLKLFSAVCDAVNYAHQNGVIHRDLKPSNILVDADGTPKVLDFGLARQLVSPDVSLISVTGQILGTLPYMSPEQARGNPDEIDTRTDIYALGVILYELLTGHYPYPVVGQMAEVLHHISETEPTPPSRRWETDSGITRRTSKRLRSGECPIDDEVQTIVLKTLSKKRERRYQSAGELARDVGHYLADEPIEAKRDSTLYLLRKLVMRNSFVAMVFVLLFVIVIAFGLVVLNLDQQMRSLVKGAERSDNASLRSSIELEQAVRVETMPAFRRNAFGWFVAAWQQGRLARAGEIQAAIPNNSSERSVANYLLDESMTFDRLLELVPKNDVYLAHFAHGLRLAKTGHSSDAIKAFKECTSDSRSRWIKQEAAAYLKELHVSARLAGESP